MGPEPRVAPPTVGRWEFGPAAWSAGRPAERAGQGSDGLDEFGGLVDLEVDADQRDVDGQDVEGVRR
jgi:hypothetical protein